MLKHYKKTVKKSHFVLKLNVSKFPKTLLPINLFIKCAFLPDFTVKIRPNLKTVLFDRTCPFFEAGTSVNINLTELVLVSNC